MVGVDKLRVLLRTTEEQTALSLPDQVKYFVDAGGSARLEGQIGADGARDMYVRGDLGKGTLVLEFNPSRLMSSAGGLCRFTEILPALHLALATVDAELGIYVLPEHRLLAVVQRVDVARDWAVVDARNLILALLPLRRPRATRLALEYDPQTALVSGVVTGNKTSNAKLYVRDGRHPEFPDADWVRFEIVARDSWLQRLLPDGDRDRPVLVRDLTPENLERLLSDRWKWSAFGTPVAAESQWWAVARDKLPLSQLRPLVGWLYALEHGQDLGYKKDAVDGFHKQLQAIGVPVNTSGDGRRRLQLASDVPRRLPQARSTTPQ